jgi:hypothetical protein
MFDAFRIKIERMTTLPFAMDLECPSMFEARDIIMAPCELVDTGKRPDGPAKNKKSLEELCRILVEKGKQDPNWIINRIVAFLIEYKDRYDRRESTKKLFFLLSVWKIIKKRLHYFRFYKNSNTSRSERMYFVLIGLF